MPATSLDDERSPVVPAASAYRHEVVIPEPLAAAEPVSGPHDARVFPRGDAGVGVWSCGPVSAGLRRGCVGIVPAGADSARDLTQWHRVTRLDVRPYLWRVDRRRNLLKVARVLERCLDDDLLLTRPGHKKIARETGLSTKTVARRIDDMHELRWLITTELGTTERIRAGRLRGGYDPHEGNRAQEYRPAIPTTVVLPDHQAGQPPRHGADQAKELSVHPSPVSPKERGGTTTSRSAHHGTTPTRARDQRCTEVVDNAGRPQAAGKYHQRHHRNRRSRPAWQDRAQQVTAVWQALPPALTQRLADHEADRLAAAIAAQLDHRTVAELADRIDAHWPYWRYKLAADLVRSPVAVAHRIIRRDYDDCPDLRCEDGHQLDTDRPCAACEQRATAHTAALGAAKPTPPARPSGRAVSGGHSAPPAHLITAPADPGATERGAARARQLLAERLPHQRRILGQDNQGAA